MGARPLSRLSLPAAPPWPVLRLRLLMGLVACAALAAAYLLWFRDSSLVAVEHVSVAGAEADPAAGATLERAGLEMTTLNVDEDALRAAVADDPAVVRIDASSDFPHDLSIAVDVREPAAYIAADGGTLLAGDGVVLATGVEPPDGIPVIDVENPDLGGRAAGSALTLARVLGPAPDALARGVERATDDPRRGPVVELASGIELRFGDASQAAAKWDAAAAVLANPGTDAASYLDLSVPGRPVAG